VRHFDLSRKGMSMRLRRPAARLLYQAAKSWLASTGTPARNSRAGLFRTLSIMKMTPHFCIWLSLW